MLFGVARLEWLEEAQVCEAVAHRAPVFHSMTRLRDSFQIKGCRENPRDVLEAGAREASRNLSAEYTRGAFVTWRPYVLSTTLVDKTRSYCTAALYLATPLGPRSHQDLSPLIGALSKRLLYELTITLKLSVKLRQDLHKRAIKELADGEFVVEQEACSWRLASVLRGQNDEKPTDDCLYLYCCMGLARQHPDLQGILAKSSSQLYLVEFLKIVQHHFPQVKVRRASDPRQQLPADFGFDAGERVTSLFL